MGNLRVERLTNKDRKFYQVLGPFLARRDVHRAIGCPPWDDDGKEWFVAFRGEAVAGFAAVAVSGGVATFCSDYTPDVVVRELLLRERQKAVRKSAEAVEAVVSAADRDTYARNGFEVVRETKNFATMRKELKWASV